MNSLITIQFYLLRPKMLLFPVMLLASVNGISQAKDTSLFDLNEWRIFLPDSVYDIDSNVYHTQQLGTQIWMVENLSTTHFNNGDEIPVIKSNTLWSQTNGPACVDIFGQTDYNGKINQHGVLYNGLVVQDERNACPFGWHIPTAPDWDLLLIYLDSLNYAWNVQLGGIIYVDDSSDYSEIQEILNNKPPVDLWNQPYLFFTGNLNGERTDSGEFNAYNNWAYWWVADSFVFVHSWYGVLDRHFALEEIYIADNVGTEKTGFSIRCIKD